MSGLLPSNQSPCANAWPKIAVSKPLMEFTHGEITKNGEDEEQVGGPGEGGMEQTELQFWQQTHRGVLGPWHGS